ncbi:MAG: ABC transporter substrate-binding protein, partial [Chloroflexi bacterium]|nr:ABC transporter substrate-binding protein [Chloroflexota bacterium]
MARRLISAALLVTLVTMTPLLAATKIQAARPASAPRALRTITLGMGYIPNVQFAPFYVAEGRGYYRQAGLRVDFAYGASPNQLELVGTGRVTFAIGDGTDVIAASAQGVPVTDVMTMYQHLPVAIFALARKNIRRVSDLRGKTVGVAGRYGSSYAALLAALRLAGLRPDRDVTIKNIGYNQAVSVQSGKVDAAVDYSNNGPVILARHGVKVDTLQIGTITNLVGPGVIAGRALIAHDPSLVRAFVQATLRGLAATIEDPRAAFAIARTAKGLPPLHGPDVADQYAVLQSTIPFWHDAVTRVHGLGYADPAQWSESARTLQEIGQIAHAPATT